MYGQKDWEYGQRDERLGNPMPPLGVGNVASLLQVGQWSPPALSGTDITLEGDEVYTRVSENLPSQ